MDLRDPEAAGGCGRKLWGLGCLFGLVNEGRCLGVSGRGSGN